MTYGRVSNDFHYFCASFLIGGGIIHSNVDTNYKYFPCFQQSDSQKTHLQHSIEREKAENSVQMQKWLFSEIQRRMQNHQLTAVKTTHLNPARRYTLKT